MCIRYLVYINCYSMASYDSIIDTMRLVATVVKDNPLTSVGSAIGAGLASKVFMPRIGILRAFTIAFKSAIRGAEVKSNRKNTVEELTRVLNGFGSMISSLLQVRKV